MCCVRFALIIFLRWPEPGMVKTRLAAAVGDTAACNIYKKMSLDLLEVCRNVKDIFDLHIFCNGADLSKFETWLGEEHHYHLQEGDDLGQKQINAFNKIFSLSYRNAVIIGSDCPAVDQTILRSSYNSLSKTEIPIGPTHDGGYYLLGLPDHALPDKIFSDIHWSSQSVYPSISLNLRRQRLAITSLPTLHDVDTASDAEYYQLLEN